MFDITSGILRRAWKFDGSDRVPEPNTVKRLLQHVGFDKVQWRCPHLMLPAEMEIDFGGLGKDMRSIAHSIYCPSSAADPFW